MGVNPGNKPVIKEWMWALSFKQQASVLSALRGCDMADKEDPAKPFCRKLRGACLHSGGADNNCEFMRANLGLEDILKFTKQIDRYPVHFILHLVHAAEIIGYNHTDEAEAKFWKTFYYKMVEAFHMLPETKELNDFRLRDGVDTYCHKT